jgi:hypothetical protein
MKKAILIIIGLTISLNSLAQTKTWVTKPYSNDTIGYIESIKNQKQQQFIITHQVTQLEFDKLLAIYGDILDIITKDGQIINQYKPQSVVVSSTTQSTNTNSQGYYLIKAGEYKNAAIAVGAGTSAIVGVILSQPMSVKDYNTKIGLAGALSAIGGIISFGLNIAGNNMLIKAGLAK